MSDNVRRPAELAEAVPSLLGRLPGRVGSLAGGTAARLRDVRFVGLVAEIAFFVGAGLAPLSVAALALLGALEPMLAPEVATRVDGVFIGAIMGFLGGDTSASAFADVQKLLNSGPSGLFLPLAIGVLFSARGFTGAMRGLGHLYGREGERPIWMDAVATVAFTVGGALLASLGALGALLAPMGDVGPVLGVFAWARWGIVPAGLMVWLTSLYRYTRGSEAGPWTSELPGAAVATAAIVLAGIAFGIYLRHAPGLGLGPFLGPVIGVALATFSLLFAYAAAVVTGGAFNAERQGDRRPRAT